MRRVPAFFTVEASLLLPPVLLTLLLVLFLCAHVHNRSVLTASACAGTVTGREQEISVLFLEDGYQYGGGEDSRRRSVSWELHTVPFVSGRRWTESKEIIYKKQYPVRFLQTAAAAGDLLPDS